jgi:DNA polymerase III epsilon subunit-like protein
MADENGHPNGILEIKTASDPSKWGKPEDGIDGVPAQYRAQALWYAQAAGFNKGAIAVMIDDHEYREYHFTMTPELKAEAQSNLEKVDSFVKEVQARKDGTWVEKQKQAIKGFSQKMVKEASKGDLSAFEDISVYREEHPTVTRRRFFQICKDVNDEKQVRSALRTLFTEKDPSTRKAKFVGVDLETSNTTPTNGRIIELGMVVKNSDGEQKDVKQLYGLPKKALQATGTGAENVHHITPGMIAKKRQFSHPEVQKEVLEHLMDSIMVAHNADYEKRFFRQHLKGFAEAEKAGRIRILDTRKLTQQLLPDTKNNTLESLSKWYGISYDGAHRAYNDADYMMRALGKLEEEIFQQT